MNISRLFKHNSEEVISLKPTVNRYDKKISNDDKISQLPSKEEKYDNVHVTQPNMSKSNFNLKEDEFILVSNKKKRLNNKLQVDLQDIDKPSRYDLFDLQLTIRRVESAKQELLTSDLYASTLASLRESENFLNNTSIKEIVCFGLGKIGDCTIARYQLALLLCMRDLYKVKTIVYDPIFNDDDFSILENFDLQLLPSNTEGRYTIRNQNTTLFYLPHCPKQLTNNLLWSNWGSQLTKCIIISNSFTKIIESNTHSEIFKNANYIYKLQPHTIELAVINSFKYYEIFNDTAIHIFPFQNISVIPLEVWENNLEPDYKSDDIEFIRDKHESLN